MKSVVLSMLLAAALPSDRSGQDGPHRDPVLRDCRVSLIEEAQVPGREAGVLEKLNIREGQQVKAGEEIGRIDDVKPQALKKVKTKEYEAALEQATDDINVRFSKEAAGVAHLTWQKAEQANKNSAGSVSEVERERLKLEYRKAVLQIEKSRFDMKIAKLTSDVKLAEVAAADAEIELRRILSPIDGVVAHVYKHEGEWVPPGDPVVHIMRVDRLRIEGFVNAANYSPGEIKNRPVLVEAELTGGRKAQFDGKIVFVSPQDQPGGDYLVWAEVDNRQEDGQWLLRPGATATMRIQLK